MGTILGGRKEGAYIPIMVVKRGFYFWSFLVNKRRQASKHNKNRFCKKPEKESNSLHQPGIEPGSVPWQGTILPLDH
ncbi:unnamed protein product [Sphagnum jensenii]|uniref:Uncharacterized protein n=1 Tax=Sphagnum jensenii TaxID=128206 RepID=A0ABP0WA73_9BRYO